MMILPRTVFYCLLVVPTLLPLVLLGRLWLAGFSAPVLRITSLGLFLCATATVALWLVTNGQTDPPLESMGLDVLFRSMVALGAICLLTVLCGLCCVKIFPWALLWLIPTVLLLATLGVGAWRVFH